MNDKSIDDLFDQNIPEAYSNARKIAINSAMSEFSQAFDDSARPIGTRGTLFSKILNHLRSFFMTTPSTPRISNTFATIAIAFIAVSVFFFLPKQSKESITLNTNQRQIDIATKSIIIPLDNDLAETAKSAIDYENRTEDKTIRRDISDPKQATRIAINRKITSSLRAERPEDEIGLIGDTSTQQKQQVLAKLREANISTAGNRVSRKKSEEREYAKASKPDGLSMADQAGPSRLAKPPTLTYSEPVATPMPRPDLNEQYAEYQTNVTKQVSDEPVSTFSADVDTASYALVRNQLKRGYLPSPQAVRAEELINYFDYDYALPSSREQPFQPSVSVLDSPWNQGKKLLHIGIKGYDLDPSEQPDSNIVFLLDVSGSMSSENKLPLVKRSIGLLLETLKPSDTVSIAVYAGAAGTVLEPTKVADKNKIIGALERLNAGGSTAGGAGIELAYQLAEQNFNKNSVNRIVLATDGDFNVGLHSNDALKTLVERKRDKGIFLSVLGFGRNNYQDDMMQALAQNGNGVAAYIDTLAEAKKVLVDEATSTLFTIAKDVKLQVEFNPAKVSEYRLIGYETRALKREDFNNDKVDAGDIGAGHTVTAIYEITAASADNQSIDTPRYTENRIAKPAIGNSQEYGFLKIRYKLPNDNKSKLIEQAISSDTDEETSETQFSVAVAGFAQLLTGGKYTASLSYDDVINLAQKAKGDDAYGYRSEFIQLVRMAKIAKP
ncbi:MAG: Ca-activated chloride channel family protein [Cryomorphaceae bacterium]|jgi:Ca-activated chloride channel family protein